MSRTDENAKPGGMGRRRFLRDATILGGGLVVGFHIPAHRADAASAGGQGAAAGTDLATEINAWVVVRTDNTVIVRYARSEMGQGSSTAVPMLVAEELECDWKQVRMEYASATEQIRRKGIWGSMLTAGSSTIRTFQQPLREAGARARLMLVAAAAQRWGVQPEECVAAFGTVSHTATGRKLRYGQVAATAAELTPPTDVKLKDQKDWRICGKSLPRLDIPDTVVGRQRFGIDVQLPGMAFAAVLQSPVFGGTVRSIDASKLQGRRGFIKVVPIEGGVAVVADNWWRANELTKELSVEWDEGGQGSVSSASIVEYLRAGLDQADAPVARQSGDVRQAFTDADKVVEAEYYTPFLAHSTLEPQVCAALVQDGRVELWPSTQDAEEALRMAAETAGVPPENVQVHRVQAGGGFGRRAISQDYVRQAVAVAMAMQGTPVKLLWSREQDTQHDFYRPAALYRLRAALDAHGNATAWTTRIAMPSLYGSLMKLQLKDGIDRAAVASFNDFPYGIASQHMDYARRDTHVPVGFCRGVGHSQNPFARECFMDELAHAAGRDPYEYRRDLLGHEPKVLGALDAAAKAAEWGRVLPPGVFRGIAVAEPYASVAAAVIEVSVSDQGRLDIHRVVVALDCGHVVNPDTALAQTQGNVVFALTSALYGEVTVKEGRVEQSNFHQYRMLGLAELPKVEVVLVPSGGPWGGVGEPGLAPVAPALCNAIFAATGQRVRSLPLKNQDLRALKYRTGAQ